MRYLHQQKTHKPKPKPSGERDLRGERVLRVERKEKRNLISDDGCYTREREMTKVLKNVMNMII